jgi:hypothetical protein
VVTGAWVPFMVGRDANIYQRYGPKNSGAK